MGKSRLIPTVFVLALLASLGWAAVYAYDKGLTKRWREMIMDELARRGIEAEIDKLTFDPFEGLVARNVSIFQDESHKSVLATINNITLDIDLARLVRKEQFLNTIDLRDADISFPIDPTKPKGKRIDIKNFSARVQMPDDTIDIQKAEFEIGGLIVSLRGALQQPSPKPDSDKSRNTRTERQFIADLISQIEKFYVAGDKPRLDIEIFGDLDNPKGIEATGNLRAVDVTRNNYSCDRLEADIEFKYPIITLDRLLVKDDYGELYGHAEHSIGGESVSFDLESSIDSHTLLRSILDTPAFGEVVFFDPPKLQMQGDYFIKEKIEPGQPPVRVFGNANCGKFKSRSEVFESFHADFSIDREKFFFRNVLLEHRTGSAEAKVLYNRDEGMRYSATVDLSPKIFSLFIDNEVAKKILDRFEFNRQGNFYVELEGRGPARDRTTWQTSGKVNAGNFHYNSVPVQNVQTKFTVKEQVLTFSDFRLDREEGFLSGKMARIDGKRQIATIEGVEGTIDPVPTTGYFAPKVAKKLEIYQFAAAPTVTLNGDIGLKGPVGNNFTVTFKSPGSARYTFLKKALPIVAPDGKATIVGTKLNLDLKSKLFSGNVDVKGNFNLKRGEKAFDATVVVDRIDFSRLVDTYEIETESQGTFTGNARLAGQIGSLESIEATGSAIIYNGNVFSIPTLGRMSKLINRMMPKNPEAGYSIANQASAKLTMSGGKLRAENFEATAGGFRIKGEGTVDLIAQEIDFNAQMNVRGAPGVVLYPVSRLFKYKGEGPISNPTWRPVNFTLPRGDGPGILGGPGILPRNRNKASGAASDGNRSKILDNGIPIVRPLRKGIVKGVLKGGEIIKDGGEAIIKTGGGAIKAGGEAIINTGEKIIGKADTEKPTPTPKAKPVKK